MLKQNLIRKNLFLCKHCVTIRIYEDSLFKRTEQVVSLSDKKSFVGKGPTCPPPRGGGIRSKVADSGREKSTNQKSHVFVEFCQPDVIVHRRLVYFHDLYLSREDGFLDEQREVAGS